MPGTFTQLLYHIVFATKRRAPLITAEIQPRLYAYMGGIIRADGGICHQIGGVADHVHLLVTWRTDESLSSLLRTLKARSSTWVHETFPHLRSFYWQDGYGAFTVSSSQSDKLATYIRNQEKHHSKLAFDEELERLLKAHGVAYDPRYLRNDR